MRYPSGTMASLPRPARPDAKTWVWTWTVPTSAKAGTATGTATCTYLGLPKAGPITFKIVDPALPGGYAIDVVNPGPRSSTDTGFLTMTIKVRGTVPAGTNYGVKLTCYIEIWSSQGLWMVSAYSGDLDFVNGSGQLMADFDIGAVGPYFVGTDTWTVKCRNVHVAADAWKQDTGPIVITAG
jgi:hypothetical protein